MKSFKYFLTLTLLSACLIACGNDTAPTNDTPVKTSQTEATAKKLEAISVDESRAKEKSALKDDQAEFDMEATQPQAPSISTDSLNRSIDGANSTEGLIEEKSGDDMERLD